MWPDFTIRLRRFPHGLWSTWSTCLRPCVVARSVVIGNATRRRSPWSMNSFQSVFGTAATLGCVVAVLGIIRVQAAQLDHFSVSQPSTPQTSGVPFQVTFSTGASDDSVTGGLNAS